ncbi:class I SAM-dependent methyltransferase [Desulfovibrio sp. JC010]|uniref:class I SAM-dependent methyltransferase n=1 Tax=Desulfovibrio sp. JC010 TaxID=2593641 RepID=UPI0013D649C0|nr:class I SAM-dependent methyltransferase [Desulfovibrio sp. JC010]NDV26327.1 class I SAM-dependent methyltransferase [Desulfovibrio sp. JC010]
MKKIFSSFRDPAGFVYEEDGKIYRNVASSYKENWDVVADSGIFSELFDLGSVPDFTVKDSTDSQNYKWLEVQKIPFISYPYEWCFSQLKDAALLTLDIQKHALQYDLSLKDSSAYNVQFFEGKPVFIDLLSFERPDFNLPWVAYRQFCMHFYAPLVIMAKKGFWGGELSKLYIDGIPLETAVSMLSLKDMLNLNVWMHLVAHAKMESRHSDGRVAAKKVEKFKYSKKKILNLVCTLREAVSALKPPVTKTEWGDYYSDTNYSSDGMEQKESIVASFASKAASEKKGSLSALDVGANTGKFSRILSECFDLVLATDIDPLAVERHYREIKRLGLKKILPLVINIANPSSGIGWASCERESFGERCSVDFITALAVIHHLRITAGIPLAMQAEYFHSLLNENGTLCVEFIPKEDSQVQRMLGAREDVFHDYNEDVFIESYKQYFSIEESLPVENSLRKLFFMRKV